MRLRTALPALALSGAILLSLASCAKKGLSTEDAAQCVQVEMDTSYKGQFDGFVKYYDNVTTQDARDQYDAYMEVESQHFLYIFGVNEAEDNEALLQPSDLQLHRLRQLYQQVCAKAEYTIASSSEQDDGTFAVKMTIKPMDIIQLVYDNLEAGFAEFNEKMDAVDVLSMSDEEFITWYNDAYAAGYYDTLLDLLEDQIPNIGYGEEKSIVVQVQQDTEDGGLFISDEDLANLDNLIINYDYDAE